MKSLSVCLIGHFPKVVDEGCRKVTLLYYTHLKEYLRVKCFNIAGLAKNLYDVWRFNPDIIHFIIGPSSITGLLLIKLTQQLFGSKSRVVLSAIQPNYPLIGGNLALCKYLLKDVTVFTQSSMSENIFSYLAKSVYFVPNGVDLNFGSSVNANFKKNGKPVILHVGACVSGRNVESLIPLQEENKWQVVIVGRASSGDSEIVSKLRNSGCTVINEYLPNITDIYKSASCYFFPVTDPNHCIDTPLSVLEAMSFNLPIATSPFGALPRMFSGDNDFIYLRSLNKDVLIEASNSLTNNSLISKNRIKVEKYNWNNIVSLTTGIYNELLEM